MRRTILCVLVAAGVTACYRTGEVAYSGTVTATTAAPDLVTVSPGVQVIADYDEPVFYADSFYWRFQDGYWYRSSWYTGGWVYATPPRAVLRIDRPYAYRHYRPHGYVARRPYTQRQYQRDYRRPPVVHRDHRRR